MFPGVHWFGDRDFFCRVDTQIAPVGVSGADTARILGERGVFAAVWAGKSALYAFWVQTRLQAK